MLGSTWRIAARLLRNSPGRSAVLVAMLSLAVGVATTMFALADALVLRPVPFPNAQELAVLSLRNGLLGSGAASPEMFSAWRNLSLLGAVEGAVSERVLVESDAGDAAVTVASVSPGMLALLGGVRPIAGRLFTVTEANGQVLISESIWRKMFANRPDIIGQTLRINAERLEVVGVLPADFHFPNRRTELWRAVDFAAPATAVRPIVYIRLAQDARRLPILAAATVAARTAEPRYSERWHADAEPLTDYLTDQYYQTAVPLLSAGVALLCIILLTNVAALMLVVVLGRRHDVAIAHALGASRRRIQWDYTVEALLIGIGGLLTGLLLSAALIEFSKVTLDGTSLMRGLSSIALNPRSVVIAAATAFSASVVVGISVWFAARSDTDASAFAHLKVSGGIGGVGTTVDRARAGLVLAQVALVTFLGYAALILVRSFVSLSSIDPGFDPAGMQVAFVAFPPDAFHTEDLRLEASQRLRTEAEAIPGVRAATWSYGTPPGGGITDTGLWTPLDGVDRSKVFSAHRLYVEPNFFSVYDLDVVAGRTFGLDDPAAATVVSERLAGLLWPGEIAVGRRFMLDGAEKEVIGIVREVRWPSLGELKDVPQYYHRLDSPGAMLTIACVGSCPSETEVRQRLEPARRGAVIGSIHQPAVLYRQELAKPVAMATVGLTIAVLAVCASAAGLFSLLAQFVGVRRREFAIRACLGASQGSLRGIVWRQALRVVVPGVLIGGVGAQWSSKAFAGLVASGGSVVALWSALAGIVATLVLVAAWVPVRTMARIAPNEVLRES